MFVCLVHCSAEYFFSHSGQAMALHNPVEENETEAHEHHHEHTSQKPHGHKTPCKGGNGCSCCDQHGNYVIKENTTVASEFQLTALQVAIHLTPFQQLPLAVGAYHAKVCWLNTTGPPVADRPLYLTHRSLLI